MKATPFILSLLGLAAVGIAASSLVGDPSDAAAQEIQDKKKPEDASKGTDKDKEKKAEKITVWIMDATGSG
ncbi:hypothetical protein Poly30_18640 [Planctomycetes bacterium Poly30]|uniref:Uncharacterized protein n=1 Tax=Saltatorellus ferox TaxID=2528018 RepID=A0A518EQM4_9BACT|nr:hypothetical protein Poly30_18640 [Planctomycetes bacterium Poly30]